MWYTTMETPSAKAGEHPGSGSIGFSPFERKVIVGLLGLIALILAAFLVFEIIDSQQNIYECITWDGIVVGQRACTQWKRS